MRDTGHFKRHLSVVTWRQDNGGKIEQIGDVPVEDPFHRTKVILLWSFWDFLKFLFSRRTVEIVVHVRSDGVSQGRWFQGADIALHVKRNAVENASTARASGILPTPSISLTVPGWSHHKSLR
jgi:hypothetical protein